MDLQQKNRHSQKPITSCRLFGAALAKCGGDVLLFHCSDVFGSIASNCIPLSPGYGWVWSFLPIQMLAGMPSGKALHSYRHSAYKCLQRGQTSLGMSSFNSRSSRPIISVILLPPFVYRVGIVAYLIANNSFKFLSGVSSLAYLGNINS